MQNTLSHLGKETSSQIKIQNKFRAAKQTIVTTFQEIYSCHDLKRYSQQERAKKILITNVRPGRDNKEKNIQNWGALLNKFNI